MRVLRPTKATPRPYTRHILGIDSGVQSHHKATTKPPTRQEKATTRRHQSHPRATPRLHQGHPKATPKPGAWGVRSYSLRIFIVFASYSLGISLVFSAGALRGATAGPPSPWLALKAMAWPLFSRSRVFPSFFPLASSRRGIACAIVAPRSVASGGCRQLQ